MADIYNDNSVPHGSRILNINAVNYVADTFTVTSPVVVVERTNENNEPTGSAGVAGFVTGSAGLQIPAGAYVKIGETFSTNVGSTSTNFVVEQAEYPEDKGAEKKQSITFRKLYA